MAFVKKSSDIQPTYLLVLYCVSNTICQLMKKQAASQVGNVHIDQIDVAYNATPRQPA